MKNVVLLIVLLSLVSKLILDMVLRIKYHSILKSNKVYKARQFVKKIPFYFRSIINDKCFIIVSEYGIYEGIYINYCGTLSGNENDNKIILNNKNKKIKINNPFITFSHFKKEHNKMIKSYDRKKYVILGDKCIFRIDIKDCEIIRINEFNNIINSNKQKVFNKNEVDEIYSLIKK